MRTSLLHPPHDWCHAFSARAMESKSVQGHRVRDERVSPESSARARVTSRNFNCRRRNFNSKAPRSGARGVEGPAIQWKSFLQSMQSGAPDLARRFHGCAASTALTNELANHVSAGCSGTNLAHSISGSVPHGSTLEGENNHGRDRMNDINAWWEQLPGEHYWLDVSGRDTGDELLASPRTDGKDTGTWAHRLITHVKDGDLVFHYDAWRQAIIAWSLADGRPVKRDLSWRLPARHAGNESTDAMLPSWGIKLRQFTRLSVAVSLQDIALTQWSLFPSLRALEDQFGDPLYYPFEMGNRDETHPLRGYVFKLPAVLVEGLPELASVAERVTRPLDRQEITPARQRVAARSALAASR